MTIRYKAIYRDAERTWEGTAGHPQVDTGLGFTCDEMIVESVVSFNKGNLRTLHSCQNTSEAETWWEKWATPRATIVFTHFDPKSLPNVCQYLKNGLSGERGWKLKVLKTMAYLSFTSNMQARIISIMTSIPPHLVE